MKIGCIQLNVGFGILVIDVVKGLGVKEPGDVAVATAKAGVFSCVLMCIIYIFITLVCAQSAAICKGVQGELRLMVMPGNRGGQVTKVAINCMPIILLSC